MAVLIEVKVIGIGKLLDRRHMVVRRHIRDGAAAYDPDHVMRFVPLEPHHDIRGQAVLHVDVFYAGFIDDINTAAVAAQHDFPVQSFFDGEALCVDDAVLFAIGRDHAISLNDIHTSGDGHEDAAILPFGDGAQTGGQQAVVLCERDHLALAVAQQAELSPGGYP